MWFHDLDGRLTKFVYFLGDKPLSVTARRVELGGEYHGAPFGN